MTLAIQPSFSTTARPRPGPGVPSGNVPIDHMPPHDLMAEAGVLGSMIIDPSCIGDVRMFLKTRETFFKEENQTIFQVICELDDDLKKIDHVVIHSTLKAKNQLDKIGGLPYILELARTVVSSSNAAGYAVKVKEAWQLRELLTAATAMIRDCFESGDNPQEQLDRASGRLFRIAEVDVVNFPRPMSEIVPEYMHGLDTQRRTGAAAGLPTGFTEIDAITGGLQNGEMILIAARPSVGKTAFAFSLLEHCGIRLKKPCGMFSLEMAKEALALRLISSLAGVDSQKIRTLTGSKAEGDRIAHAAAEACCPHIFVDDTPGMGLVELRTKALRLKRMQGIVLLAVDYIGLMRVERGRNRTRNEEVGQLSIGLKSLARELGIPILVLSQLNRQCEDERRPPRCSDLRDSGNLEQDADLILLLHREAVYHRGDEDWAKDNAHKLNEAIVIVGKQRNGAADAIKLTFLPWCTRFVNNNPGI